MSEVQENSYPLPYISRTYLVWEFLASDLSLRRVQCAIIFDAPILSFRHLVLLFHTSQLDTQISASLIIITLPSDKYIHHIFFFHHLYKPSIFFIISLTSKYSFILHFKILNTLFKHQDSLHMLVLCKIFKCYLLLL